MRCLSLRPIEAGNGFLLANLDHERSVSCCTTELRIPPWGIGVAVGLLVSAADAVITKAYAPILVLGAIGGGVIGWLVGRFGQ